MPSGPKDDQFVALVLHAPIDAESRTQRAKDQSGPAIEKRVEHFESFASALEYVKSYENRKNLIAILVAPIGQLDSIIEDIRDEGEVITIPLKGGSGGDLTIKMTRGGRKLHRLTRSQSGEPS